MNNIASFHDNFKIIPTPWNRTAISIGCLQVRTKVVRTSSLRARCRTYVKPFRVYSRKKESIAAKKDLGIALCFDFVYCWCQPRFSESLLSTARAFLSPPRVTLGSHSTWPSRSVVTARRLYKFYIIFMRHKVVEKPTEKRGEKKRVRVRERRRGSSRSKSSLSATLPPPPVRAIVTWLGGAACIPSCLLVGVGYEREGKADDRRRGCCAALGVVVVVVNCSSLDEHCILRNASCLVLLKNSRSLILFFLYL